MKKIIALVLCLIMLVIPMTSCSNQQSDAIPTAMTKTPSNEADIPEKIKSAYFDNEEINFIMCGGEASFRSIQLPEGDDETNHVNVAVAVRNNRMQEKLGIVIGESRFLTPTEMTECMRLFFASPDSKYDIVGAYEYYDLGLAFGENEGGFIDYNTVSENDMLIDLDAPYWDMNSYNALTVDGKSYWLTGDISIERSENILVSFVNTSLWEHHAEEIEKVIGYSDLAELVKAGKWTYENVAKLGGIISYGLDSALGNTSAIVMASQGLDTGFSLNANELSAVAQRGKALFADTGLLPNVILTDDSSVSPFEKFAEGSGLMVFGTVGDGMEIMRKRVAKLDYFMVPLPKCDANADYSTSVYGKSNVFGILSVCENVAAATAVLEYMAYWGREQVNDEMIEKCVPVCYCDHGKQMSEIALYCVQNVNVITNAAISYENYYEETITGFIKKNMFKGNFEEIINDRSVDFDSYFTKLKTEVLHKTK